MSRDASGNYSLPAGNPVSAGTTIEASWANDTMDDVATALTNSLDRTGKGQMTAAFKVTDGTVGSPGLQFGDDTDTGVYRIGANNLGIAVNGTKIVDVSTTGVSITGTIALTSTIDGRDLATDGTKLDGIETGATADQAWGDITGTLSSQSDLQAALDAKQATLTDTDGLTEGSTNLYYTTARANSAIDARVDKAFVDALNVDADTLDALNSTQLARTDTAETFDAAVTFAAEIIETTGTMPSGTTPAIDPVNGTIQEWTLTGTSTPTDSLADGESVTLFIDDGADYEITWPTIEWIGGAAPTLDTTDTNVVVLTKVGSTLIGAFAGVSST